MFVNYNLGYYLRDSIQELQRGLIKLLWLKKWTVVKPWKINIVSRSMFVHVSWSTDLSLQGPWLYLLFEIVWNYPIKSHFIFTIFLSIHCIKVLSGRNRYKWKEKREKLPFWIICFCLNGIAFSMKDMCNAVFCYFGVFITHNTIKFNESWILIGRAMAPLKKNTICANKSSDVCWWALW